MEGVYCWQMDYVYQFIKSLQLDCLVMNNFIIVYFGVFLYLVDICSGEKYIEVVDDQKVWNWLGKDCYLLFQIEIMMFIKGDKKFFFGNWFWYDWDKFVLEKEKIL